MHLKFKILMFFFFFNFLNCVNFTFAQVPEIWIRQTPNAGKESIKNFNKILINFDESQKFTSYDVKSVFDFAGVNNFQSGSIGQQTSVFTRGSNSNHTLVLLNGIPINDQSTTNGLYDFGQDFITNLSSIEIYKGPSSIYFGSDAIGGAINYITAPKKKDSISYGTSGSLGDTHFSKTIFAYNTISSLQGGFHQSKDSSAMTGSEKDLIKNKSGSMNIQKWINDNISISSSVTGRHTYSQIDNSAIKQIGYDSTTLFGAFQGNLDFLTRFSSTNLRLHHHFHKRKYNSPNNEFDEYNSNSNFLRLEHSNNTFDNLHFGGGVDYKIDKANFANRGSYNSSLAGDYSTQGYFGNLSYFFDKTLSSTFLYRINSNSVIGDKDDYKLSITKKIVDNFDVKLSHGTGHKNPSLYELYGADNFGYRGNKNLKAEEAKLNEVTLIYNPAKDTKVGVTLFKNEIQNLITYVNNTYSNSSGLNNQNGLELNLNYSTHDYNMGIFANNIISQDSSNLTQLRRPRNTLGINFKNKITENSNYFLNYSYTGNYFDTHSTSYERIKMDNVNITNIGVITSYYGTSLIFGIKNLLNENYEKPHGYSNRGRHISLNLETKY